MVAADNSNPRALLAHKKGAVPTADDIKEYEEFFRSNRKAAAGKLPDTWLIHLSDKQLEAAQAARQRILKEKADAGDAAWKEWVLKQNNKKMKDDGEDAIKTPEKAWGGHAFTTKTIKEQPLLSKEAREAAWEEWCRKKEKELAEAKAQAQQLREKLIEESLRKSKASSSAAASGSLSPLRHHHTDGVSASTSLVRIGKSLRSTVSPTRPNRRRKRPANAIQVALCQSSISPYLIHPAKPYKKENIRAQEEMKQIKELSMQMDANKTRLSLPEVWKHRVEKALPTIMGDRSLSPVRRHRATHHPSGELNSSLSSSAPAALGTGGDTKASPIENKDSPSIAAAATGGLTSAEEKKVESPSRRSSFTKGILAIKEAFSSIQGRKETDDNVNLESNQVNQEEQAGNNGKEGVREQQKDLITKVDQQEHIERSTNEECMGEHVEDVKQAAASPQDEERGKTEKAAAHDNVEMDTLQETAAPQDNKINDKSQQPILEKAVDFVKEILKRPYNRPSFSSTTGQHQQQQQAEENIYDDSSFCSEQELHTEDEGNLLLHGNGVMARGSIKKKNSREEDTNDPLI